LGWSLLILFGLLVDNCYLFFRQCLDSLSLYKLYSLWLDGHRTFRVYNRQVGKKLI
jgi:hypothetical protein